jgi:hypothetical protein
MSHEELMDTIRRLQAEGKTEAEIAEELGLSTTELRALKVHAEHGVSFEVVELPPEANMWFPGPDSLYKGREGVYARSAIEFPRPELIRLVVKRIEEDGKWILDLGLTGGNEELMHKMIQWASNPRNITQCFDSNAEQNPTVDWICRELANAAKRIGEGSRG